MGEALASPAPDPTRPTKWMLAAAKGAPSRVRGRSSRRTTVPTPVHHAPSSGKALLAAIVRVTREGEERIPVVGEPSSYEEVVHPLDQAASLLRKMASAAVGNAPSFWETGFAPSEAPYARSNPGIARGDLTPLIELSPAP